MKLKKRILPFYQAIPKLLSFQVVSFLLLSLVTWAVSSLCSMLLGLTGKVAITSGDIGSMFTRWEGYAIIVLTLLMVLAYVAVELNALVIYCSKLIAGENPSVWRCIIDGFAGLKKYLNLRGLIIVIYAVLLAPILGLGFSLSVTSTFYVPRFIMSVIYNNPVFLTAYIIVVVLLTAVAIIYSFIVHGALIDGMTMKEAGINSRNLVKKNLKNYIFEIICYVVLLEVVLILLLAVATIPLLVVQFISMSENTQIFCNILFTAIPVTVTIVFSLLSVSFVVLKISMLYKKYSTDGEWSYQPREKKHHPFIIIALVLMLIFIVLISIFGTMYFDEVFDTQIDTEIIAHRAGGVEAPENTVKGIETAVELGAKGCEIDIQRTSDGYYVVNHDADFARTAGVAKKPSEMTLAEVRELRVDGEPVPTLEEMLDASKDKAVLFVELKGETADDQMADDAVRIIKEKGMEDQAVLISLKYDLLEYVEQKYPEMLTGYLAFISFGEIESTPFDYLALEEEISTDENINAIHDKGKKIMVWTVNDEDDIESFMNSDADAIITDSVKLAGEIKTKLSEREPIDLILNKVGSLAE